MTTSTAALTYVALSVVVIGFQIGLAAGLPWGKLAMGGRYPGRFPAKMRVGAVVQAAILGLLAVVVVTRAGMIRAEWSSIADKLIWIVVGFATISLVLNLITPSKWERILWAPVAAMLLLTAATVALG